jgi:peptide/nickel transport system substrate-binding protein
MRRRNFFVFAKHLLAMILAPVLIAAAFIACTPAAKEQEEDALLTFGVDTFGNETLDITVATSNVGAFLEGTFESFFIVTEEGGDPSPGIVKSWEMDPDGLTWTFHLRDDVYFHDGVNADGTSSPASKLTAKDIVFSFHAAQRDEGVKAPQWRTIYGNPPNVEAIDDYTVRLVTPLPHRNLLLNVTAYYGFTDTIWVVPKDYVEKNGWEWFRDHPIGTGPYKVVNYVRGDEMEFAFFDGYWGPVPDFKRVRLYLVPEETTRINMVQTGMIDGTQVGLERGISLKKEGASLITGQSVEALFNFFGAYRADGQSSPISDIRVRKALFLAIDRQSIIDSIYAGLGSLPKYGPRGSNLSTVFDVSHSNLAQKWKPWFDENIRYDPAEATRLLEEYKKETGKEVAFDFWVAPADQFPNLQDLVMVCVGYWEKVGVRATVIPVDSGAYIPLLNTYRGNLTLVGKMAASAKALQIPTIRSMNDFGHDFTYSLLDGSPLGDKMHDLYYQAAGTMDEDLYVKIVDEMVDIALNSYTSLGIVVAPKTILFGPRVDASKAYVPTGLGLGFAEWKKKVAIEG